MDPKLERKNEKWSLLASPQMKVLRKIRRALEVIHIMSLSSEGLAVDAVTA